jgi:hypothetical protein
METTAADISPHTSRSREHCSVLVLARCQLSPVVSVDHELTRVDVVVLLEGLPFCIVIVVFLELRAF